MSQYRCQQKLTVNWLTSMLAGAGASGKGFEPLDGSPSCGAFSDEIGVFRRPATMSAVESGLDPEVGTAG